MGLFLKKNLTPRKASAIAKKSATPTTSDPLLCGQPAQVGWLFTEALKPPNQDK
jgi:hypothetical protein